MLEHAANVRWRIGGGTHEIDFVAVFPSNTVGIFDPGGTLSRGSALTARCCREEEKPFVILGGFPVTSRDVTLFRAFLAQHRPRVLNVAGNRESKTPGIRAHVFQVLSAALSADMGE